MKHMKKLSSLLLVLVLALALAAPAMAEDFARFEAFSGDDGFKYELFKIMDAELVDDSLQNFSWPQSPQFDKARFVAYMKALSVSAEGELTDEQKVQKRAKELFDALPAGYTDADIARALDTLRNEFPNPDLDGGSKGAGSLVAKALESSRTSIPSTEINKTTGVEVTAGYYMIKTTYPDGTTRNTLYNVKGTEGTLTIKDKSTGNPDGDPTLYKKVWDSKTSAWVDAADYPEGETFSFQLSTTINGYDAEGSEKTYTLVFHDQMDTNQLQLPGKDAIRITIKRPGTDLSLTVTDFDFVAATDGSSIQTTACQTKDTDCAFHVSFDVKPLHFTDADGNPVAIEDGDEVTVEYTSKLMDGASLGTAGNVNGAWLETPKGTTPVDEATVYSFQLTASKQDGGTKEALPGATFQLYKQNGAEWTAVGEKIGSPVLVNDAGNPVDPDGNAVQAGEPLWYNHRVISQNSDGTVAVTETPTTDITDDMSQFSFPKLAEGKYKLEEVDYPLTSDGKTYNQAGPYYFEVKANYKTNTDGSRGALESITVTVQDQNGSTITENKPIDLTVGSDQGTISTIIVNNTGFEMPSTGGIGTTIFYIVGGILAAGAVILLVTKRRMRVEEE